VLENNLRFSRWEEEEEEGEETEARVHLGKGDLIGPSSMIKLSKAP
jgi:hypothetical protein